MAEDTARAVIEIIAEQAMLAPDDIALDASPDDLGLDSLALVEIVFAIEERFDISVPYNANAPEASDFSIATVADTIDGVRRLTAARG